MKNYIINQEQLNATIELIHKGKYDIALSLTLTVLKNLHSLPVYDKQEKDLKENKTKK